MAQIGYTDKVAINANPDIPEINKITDANMNEIKSVVNANEVQTIGINDATVLANITTKAITPTAGSNYSGYGNSFYYKIGTRVHVHLGLQGLTANTSQNVATMPSGYKPAGTFAIIGLGGSQSEIIGGQQYEGGTISIRPASQYALFDYEYDAYN